MFVVLSMWDTDSGVAFWTDTFAFWADTFVWARYACSCNSRAVVEFSAKVRLAVLQTKANKDEVDQSPVVGVCIMHPVDPPACHSFSIHAHSVTMNFYGQLEPAAVPAAALASPAASKGLLQPCDDSTMSEIITAPSSRVRRSRAPSREPMGRRIRTRRPVKTSKRSSSSSSEEGALSELSSSTPVAPGARSPPTTLQKAPTTPHASWRELTTTSPELPSWHTHATPNMSPVVQLTGGRLLCRAPNAPERAHRIPQHGLDLWSSELW